MAIIQNKIRIAIRWMHIIFGLVIMCYIYSPWHQYVIFQLIMKFVIIPIITMTGIWIWKFKEINAFLRIK